MTANELAYVFVWILVILGMISILCTAWKIIQFIFRILFCLLPKGERDESEREGGDYVVR